MKTRSSRFFPVIELYDPYTINGTDGKVSRRRGLTSVSLCVSTVSVRTKHGFIAPGPISANPSPASPNRLPDLCLSEVVFVS